MLLGLLFVIATHQSVFSHSDKCPKHFEKISGLSNEKCYHFNGNKLMNKDQADEYCTTLKSVKGKYRHDVRLVTPTTLEELGALDVFSGLDGTKSKTGYWLDYRRGEQADVGFPNYMDIRSNKTLYINDFDQTMPVELWREGQPGDKTDYRDEQCVARKAPNNPEFIGVDSYVCDGTTPKALHYPMCDVVIARKVSKKSKKSKKYCGK